MKMIRNDQLVSAGLKGVVVDLREEHWLSKRERRDGHLVFVDVNSGILFWRRWGSMAADYPRKEGASKPVAVDT